MRSSRPHATARRKGFPTSSPPEEESIAHTPEENGVRYTVPADNEPHARLLSSAPAVWYNSGRNEENKLDSSPIDFVLEFSGALMNEVDHTVDDQLHRHGESRDTVTEKVLRDRISCEVLYFDGQQPVVYCAEQQDLTPLEPPQLHFRRHGDSTRVTVSVQRKFVPISSAHGGRHMRLAFAVKFREVFTVCPTRTFEVMRKQGPPNQRRKQVHDPPFLNLSRERSESLLAMQQVLLTPEAVEHARRIVEIADKAPCSHASNRKRPRHAMSGHSSSGSDMHGHPTLRGTLEPVLKMPRQHVTMPLRSVPSSSADFTHEDANGDAEPGPWLSQSSLAGSSRGMLPGLFGDDDVRQPTPATAATSSRRSSVHQSQDGGASSSSSRPARGGGGTVSPSQDTPCSVSSARNDDVDADELDLIADATAQSAEDPNASIGSMFAASSAAPAVAMRRGFRLDYGYGDSERPALMRSGTDDRLPGSWDHAAAWNRASLSQDSIGAGTDFDSQCRIVSEEPFARVEEKMTFSQESMGSLRSLT